MISPLTFKFTEARKGKKKEGLGSSFLFYSHASSLALSSVAIVTQHWTHLKLECYSSTMIILLEGWNTASCEGNTSRAKTAILP